MPCSDSRRDRRFRPRRSPSRSGPTAHRWPPVSPPPCAARLSLRMACREYPLQLSASQAFALGYLWRSRKGNGPSSPARSDASVRIVSANACCPLPGRKLPAWAGPSRPTRRQPRRVGWRPSRAPWAMEVAVGEGWRRRLPLACRAAMTEACVVRSVDRGPMLALAGILMSAPRMFRDSRAPVRARERGRAPAVHRRGRAARGAHPARTSRAFRLRTRWFLLRFPLRPDRKPPGREPARGPYGWPAARHLGDRGRRSDTPAPRTARSGHCRPGGRRPWCAGAGLAWGALARRAGHRREMPMPHVSSSLKFG